MITIVSGLPRSGTSMIMQMLANGGMEILTDNIRSADDNNPRGYYEYEKVKSLQKDNTWLKEADGKAIKVIAQLLHYLSPEFKYTIIFMERNFDELLLSQEKMLTNLGSVKRADPEILRKTYSKHVNQVKEWIAQALNTNALYLKYNDVINDPLKTAGEINYLLNGTLDEVKMASVVDKKLYRNRVDKISG